MRTWFKTSLRRLICTSQYTSPPTALGFWFALEKCSPENGALSFLPGSHLTTPITQRFVRLPSGGTGFEKLVSPEVEKQIEQETQGDYIMEECGPGMYLCLSDNNYFV